MALLLQHSPLCRLSRNSFPSLHSFIASNYFSAQASSAGGTTRPLVPHPISPRRTVPPHIAHPPYAKTGNVPHNYFDFVIIHKPDSITKMQKAAQLARRSLDYACSLAKPGITADEIDGLVHSRIVSQNAYPSPLNYAGFPKSLCSSVNEVICHGIPDMRPLQHGDVVSFDVSVFLDGVHGDNCATVVVVGDDADENDEQTVRGGRRLIKATQESLDAAIKTCQPGSCLSEIGGAIEDVADKYGYNSVRKYRGHGIGEVFHSAPYVKHYRNNDELPLEPGMIFTIEPMIVEGHYDCYEWESDGWTVVTTDGKRAAQFEHTVLITQDGVEILTLP